MSVVERVEASPSLGGRVGPARLPAVFAFTFLNSVGSGLVTSGVTFVTKQGLGFSQAANFGLALLIGVTYIAGALGAGRLVGRLRRAGLSSRGVLAGLMVVLGSLCALPFAAARLGDGTPPAWTIWVMVGLYSPLTGVLWPMVESFVSGGRSGERLRSVLGVWNIVWSSALVFAAFAAAPVIKPYPALALLGLGGMHLLALGALLGLPKEPAPHLEEHHGPVPASYRRLLSAFRVLLPTSYLVSSALNPMLPELMSRYPVSPAVQVWAAAAWLVARPITFWGLAAWQGWHGSRAMPMAGAGLLVGAFALAAAASRIDQGMGGLALQIVALFGFGVAMATIYTGALYYAMAVGQAEVDAGGTHEALIGVGYTVGPGCGLAAAGLAAGGALSADRVDVATLVSVVAIALVTGGIGLRRAWAGAGRGV